MELKKYKLGELLSKIENGAVIKQNKGAKGIPITRIETLSNGRISSAVLVRSSSEEQLSKISFLFSVLIIKASLNPVLIP